MKEENNRRMPADKCFMEKRDVFDILYGLIQIESNWSKGDNHRYIKKYKIKKTKWAKMCGVSRPTFNKVFNKLIEYGYLVDCDEYYKVPNIGDYYLLVPLETLKFLVNTSNSNTIKVFIKLSSLYRSYGNDAYFTQNSLLKSIGYNSTSGSNHKLIRDILKNLENNGFVKLYDDEQDGINVKKMLYFNLLPDKIKTK